MAGSRIDLLGPLERVVSVLPAGLHKTLAHSLSCHTPCNRHLVRRLQPTSDYIPQLEGFVPLLCRDANPRLPYSGGRDAAATAAGTGCGSSACASSAKGGGAGAAADPDTLSALRAACLRGLLEHLRFCARASYVSHHLDTLTYCVLDCMEHGELTPGAGELRRWGRRAAEAVLGSWECRQEVAWSKGS